MTTTTKKSRPFNMKRAKEAMLRAKGDVGIAEARAMEAIETGARAAMTAPIASEYVQGMGAWYFVVIVPRVTEDEEDGFYEGEVGRADVDDFLRRVEEFVPGYRPHARVFAESVRQVAALHDDYEEIFGRPAAGTPMRFTQTGPVTKEW